MGIRNLYKLITKYAPSSIKHKTINDYKNKIIGIDADNFLYKLIYAIRGRGYDIKNDNKIITHIYALFLKLRKFKELNIKVIFVFDGEAPEIKLKELDTRYKIKKELIEKYKESKKKDDKRKLFYLNSYLTDNEINECKELIKIFGFNYIDAVEENDSQLGYMSKKGLIDYIISDDLDILLFGGRNILKNFTIAKNKSIIEINKKDILKELKYNEDNLINLGLLLGSDYTDYKKISINESLKLINEYKTISKINENLIDKNKKDNYIKALNYFKKPKIIKKIEIETKELNKKKLIVFLKEKKFSNEKIKKLIENI